MGSPSCVCSIKRRYPSCVATRTSGSARRGRRTFSHGARTSACPVMTVSPFSSEEHTSELQSLMRISYAVFCLKKKKHNHRVTQQHNNQQLGIKHMTTQNKKTQTYYSIIL